MLRCTLATLADTPVQSPATIVVGPVAALDVVHGLVAPSNVTDAIRLARSLATSSASESSDDSPGPRETPRETYGAGAQSPLVAPARLVGCRPCSACTTPPRGEVRELALREPGKVSIYLCGPTVYGPPHLGHGRATLVYDVLAPLPRVDAASRCGSCRTSPTSTTRSSTGPTRGPRPWHEIATQVRGGLVRGDGRHRRRPPDRHPPRHRLRRRRWSTMIGQLVDDRPGLRHRRRRLPRRRDGRGLRPARPPVARRHARRRRRARGLRRRAEAPPGRLRAVEAGQAGRAVVAVAVGRRAARAGTPSAS